MTETVFNFSKTGKYYFDRDGLEGQEDVWDIPAPNAIRRYRHAAPFPEALVRRCLAAGCPTEGVVLDPYAGSGTTLSVAALRGHPCIGIELNPHYWTLAGFESKGPLSLSEKPVEGIHEALPSMPADPPTSCGERTRMRTPPPDRPLIASPLLILNT
jgi:hypothetical protein